MSIPGLYTPTAGKGARARAHTHTSTQTYTAPAHTDGGRQRERAGGERDLKLGSKYSIDKNVLKLAVDDDYKT